MMPDCTITITGPGEMINNELAVIEKAFRDIGYEVVVDNKHPDKMTNEERLKFIESLQNRGTVKIIMQHCPWGA